MPLQKVEAKVERQAGCFAFPMRVAGSDQTVEVIIPDVVATTLGWPADEMLRVEVEAGRTTLEALASEKFDQGFASPDGKLMVALNDVVRFDE
ncbi:hypothetical protein [Methylocystis bryophila]|uniref:Uncharacterized protein n=1 Tax=Methylocystis bryophila TaxID=655015 RepID=A0A1W6MVA5_9HYPH|nr:hypothetical protein [Methylocystis bryophila]ARN81543.1 hypothetical protein B1812_11200 [Methylocystis bryophila]BDV37570.1 hypothetical protein DSM21852_08230 [Methylocystis bryophila]